MATTTTSCIAAKNISVPFKYTVSQSRRRARLKIPVRLDDLRAVVMRSFPEFKGRELKVTYVDDENDEIVVLSNEELEEALSIFNKLGRILSFAVSVVSKESDNMSAPSLPAATMHGKKKADTCDAKTVRIQIVLENGSLAQLFPNNIIVTPKPGKRTQLSTASIPQLTVNNGKVLPYRRRERTVYFRILSHMHVSHSRLYVLCSGFMRLSLDLTAFQKLDGRMRISLALP